MYFVVCFFAFSHYGETNYALPANKPQINKKLIIYDPMCSRKKRRQKPLHACDANVWGIRSRNIYRTFGWIYKRNYLKALKLNFGSKPTVKIEKFNGIFFKLSIVISEARKSLRF